MVPRDSIELPTRGGSDQIFGKLRDVPRIFGLFNILIQKLQSLRFEDLPALATDSLAVVDEMFNLFEISTALIPLHPDLTFAHRF